MKIFSTFLDKDILDFENVKMLQKKDYRLVPLRNGKCLKKEKGRYLSDTTDQRERV